MWFLFPQSSSEHTHFHFEKSLSEIFSLQRITVKPVMTSALSDRDLQMDRKESFLPFRSILLNCKLTIVDFEQRFFILKRAEKEGKSSY